MKIQAKTTLLFTILTATIFLILDVSVYIFINSFAHRDFNKRLELRARMSATFRFGKDKLSTQAMRELQQQYLETLPEERSFVVPVDSIISYTKNDVPQRYLQDVAAADGATVYYQSRFRHFAGLLYKHGNQDYIVIGSATNKYGEEMMRQLRIIKLVTFISSVILIYTVGLYFSSRTFQPIRDIINRVKELTHGNLHLRLNEREGNDEIAELTSTFNQMMNRLETAFEAQNNFISNASHELRTPLTAIIGEADYALTKDRSPEAYQYSLQQIAQQAEKLRELSKGLLALAQTGFDGKSQSWQRIRLDQLLFDVKEDCNDILPANNVQLKFDDFPQEEEGMTVPGNYDMLKVAINNIVLNACKYSDNKAVQLSLSFNQGEAVIVVQDQGIGIPNEELKYIYDPFFRASNTKEYEGHGIGMPLSNNIIRLHKGRIEVKSDVNIGTQVKVTLPLV